MKFKCHLLLVVLAGLVCQHAGLAQAGDCPPPDSAYLQQVRETAVKGSTLRIPLPRGDTIDLVASDSRKDQWYDYERYLDDIDFHMIFAQWYEGSSWVLVHRCTGDIIRIDVRPLVSQTAVTSSQQTKTSCPGTRLIESSFSA